MCLQLYVFYLFYSIRRHQERRAILTPILTDFSVRVTAAPAIIFSRSLSPDSGKTEVRIDSAVHILHNFPLCAMVTQSKNSKHLLAVTLLSIKNLALTGLIYDEKIEVTCLH